MESGQTETLTCRMCGRSVPADDAVRWGAVRPGVRHLIEADRPGWDPEDVICLDDLAKYRRAYVENLIEEERGEIGDLESQVIAAMTNEQLVSRNPVEDAEDMLTFGQRVSDRVAAFGGSWVFIIGFMGVLTAWMAVNVVGILAKPFDPYPFILLNLVLSTLAALQAPIIMMSQKRQEQKDRLRAENDYRVNLKAELEIRQLHEKIDHQLARQWEKLVELQQIQIDLLEESIDERRRK